MGETMKNIEVARKRREGLGDGRNAGLTIINIIKKEGLPYYKSLPRMLLTGQSCTQMATS